MALEVGWPLASRKLETVSALRVRGRPPAGIKMSAGHWWTLKRKRWADSFPLRSSSLSPDLVIFQQVVCVE
ncbi:MAG: hypothetical protein S4CHLAM102_11780 [Chlamydiia bacterium]|nr:hypothetical protein [Chlamydiia bacterium]